ncbi:Mannosyl-oligosaccharide 1 [Escovopsis weberi]|uniref:alpha-1,2-Mannosidase n=1 Tax=Escovopsis weberi TaxID=150374 RepID=A0A0M8MZN1_ESCWE|nr:Mannosyl-oligosaccharide 1 [Escovopsis weberi]
MSFTVPKQLPDFGDPHRLLEDRAWAAISKRPGAATAHSLLAEVQGRAHGLFEPSVLPMYKDKPYAYAPSMRRPWWRRRRATLAGLAALSIVFLLYLRGFFSRRDDRHAGSALSWLGLPPQEYGAVDWDHRRRSVVEAFELSWAAYERHAWGYDEFHPISKTGHNMAPKGLGWIIIDSLDTMMLMNLTSQLRHAREWLSTSLTWEQDQDVNTFETTIRMLGGLLSAHYLSTEFPDLAPLPEEEEEDDGVPGTGGEDLYLEKARDLADRLMSAFDSDSGIPYASVNLEKYRGIPSHADLGASSTAEAATLQLEFKYLAKLTGERSFWDKAERVMKIMDDNHPQDGLVPIFIRASDGTFQGQNIRLGSRGDSYYEYLIKQYLQTNERETVYRDMWDEALAGVRKHLVTYTEPSGFTIIGERPAGLDEPLFPKMDHLVCFMPGTIALAATGGATEAEARARPTWSARLDADMRLARELMHTCWATYKFMATGLAPEIMHFNVGEPPAAEADPHPRPPERLDGRDREAAWHEDMIAKPADVHNLQRPETVESLFYMWRITGDVKYREWGWEMFMSFMNYTAVEDQGGFTSLLRANEDPPMVKDNMESFWLAETLKYMYLLFSPDDVMPLDKIVLNTEAHPFPRFDMGQLFSTGWKRQPRDKGKNAKNGKKEEEEEEEEAKAAESG